jgi:hypothetical protein
MAPVNHAVLYTPDLGHLNDVNQIYQAQWSICASGAHSVLEAGRGANLGTGKLYSSVIAHLLISY